MPLPRTLRRRRPGRYGIGPYRGCGGAGVPLDRRVSPAL